MGYFEYIKSPLNYTGGKYKLLDYIVPTFGSHTCNFVDLFAGGFNVGINVNADTIFCNDHITFVIEMYEMFKSTDTSTLIAMIKDKIKEYNLCISDDSGYLRLRNDYNRSPSSLSLFLLTCYSFNHQIRFNSRHEFNTPFGRERSEYNKSIERNLWRFCNALRTKNIVFTSNDFSVFDFSALNKGDIVYCDPPYLISTSTYNDGKRGFKDWTTNEEALLLDLLDELDNRGIEFALSNVLWHKGVRNELLVNWSKKYNVRRLSASYSNCSYHFRDRATETAEVLITNYDRGVVCEQMTLIQ